MPMRPLQEFGKASLQLTPTTITRTKHKHPTRPSHQGFKNSSLIWPKAFKSYDLHVTHTLLVLVAFLLRSSRPGMVVLQFLAGAHPLNWSMPGLCCSTQDRKMYNCWTIQHSDLGHVLVNTQVSSSSPKALIGQEETGTNSSELAASSPRREASGWVQTAPLLSRSNTPEDSSQHPNRTADHHLLGLVVPKSLPSSPSDLPPRET